MKLPLPLHALLIALPLCLCACRQPKATDPPFTEAQEKRLREMLREEIAAAKLPAGTVATDSPKVRDEVDKLVLARIREEIPKMDWQGRLQDKSVLEALSKADPNRKRKNLFDRQDLSAFPTLKAKIEHVVKSLEGVNTYSSNTPLSKQLRELGPGAKEALWEALSSDGSSRMNGTAQYLLKDALNGMLTIDDKDLLLKDLSSPNPQLLDIIQKLHVEEAGPVALQKLQEAAGNPQKHLDYRIPLLALELDEEKALPLVLKQISTGRNAAYLAEKVEEMLPEVDMTAQLRSAVANGSEAYDSPRYAELMLKRGMPEGLGLAAESLLELGKNGSFFHNADEVRSAVRRYVNVTGSDAEVAQWILDNRSKLVWNPQSKMFEEK